ncbi:MAG: ABC transporter permease [Chloroflexi bacterium]|nr:ABC transporter permease [Chloroflexota bacterium]
MSKIYLIAKTEYTRMVRRRAFVLATLGIPLFIAGIIGLSIFFSVTRGESELPLAYVDASNVIKAEIVARYSSGDIGLTRYDTEEAALATLQAGDISAYYVVPPDYLVTGALTLNYWDESPSDEVQALFRRVLRSSLVADEPEAIRARLLNGVHLTLRSADGQKEADENEFINFILPFFVGMFFVFVVMGSAGYLLRAISTEKENRMVEVMFTSVAPSHLILGKTLGLMAVALTQVAIWVTALLAAVIIGARFVPFLQVLAIPWSFALIVILFFLPTYALVAGIMITVGSMFADMQQGQQVAGMVNLLFVFPFFFTVLIFTNPDSPILVALTLFPTTAFITVTMRWGVTAMPMWQLIASWLILVITAGFSVLIATRVFRVGMLRYGQSLKLRNLTDIIRTGDA